jgi:hypothetical protein
VAVEAGDVAGASMRDSWSFSSVERGEAMEGWPRRTCSMPGASLKVNANRIPANSALCTPSCKSKSRRDHNIISPNPDLWVIYILAPPSCFPHQVAQTMGEAYAASPPTSLPHPFSAQRGCFEHIQRALPALHREDCEIARSWTFNWIWIERDARY